MLVLNPVLFFATRAAMNEGQVTISDVNTFLNDLSKNQDSKHQEKLFRDMLHRYPSPPSSTMPGLIGRSRPAGTAAAS
jgi:hypothetical protein